MTSERERVAACIRRIRGASQAFRATLGVAALDRVADTVVTEQRQLASLLRTARRKYRKDH